MLHPIRWITQDNSSKLRNKKVCLGALYQSKLHCAVHEILWRDLFWEEALALHPQVLGDRTLLHL